LAAGLVERERAGFFRSLFRTPMHRDEEMRARSVGGQTLREFGLEDFADVKARAMPGGARRTLMIALAAATNGVVLLDEPSAGLTRDETDELAIVLNDLKRKGAALIVVEHNLRLLERVADVITVLDGGRVLAHGAPQHIYDHAEVRRAYLGSQAPGRSR
jgi:branched-chain amino acid transport system ATP-binding protein